MAKAKQPRRRRKHLLKKELEALRTQLIEKRREILGNVLSMENDTLKKNRAELSTQPSHMGDLGSDTYETEHSLNLVDSERNLIKEIDQALARIEDGTYGICLGNGEPIAKARLAAIPWAKYSIEFANDLEQGRVREPGTEEIDEDAA